MDQPPSELRERRESPAEPSATEKRLAAKRLVYDLTRWLDESKLRLRDEDVGVERVVVELERRRLLLKQVERLRADPLANVEAAEAKLDAQVTVCRDLLDAIVAAGVRKRIGYRFVLRDQTTYQHLVNLGASGDFGRGVAVCRDCLYVFEPRRKSAAVRCELCDKHRRLPFEPSTIEGAAWPCMRFEPDPLDVPDTGPSDVTFKGWTQRRFRFCHECDQSFEASRSDRVTCSGACREARRKRRAGGDDSDLSPRARESRAERRKMRKLLGAPS